MLLFQKSTFSQEIFQKGYIVKLNKDTVKGYIQIDSPDAYHDAMIFKKTKKSKVKTYTPSSIKSFCIGKNKIYKAFDFPLMDKNHLLLGTQDRKFLKAISLGVYEFYLYQTDNINMFYVHSAKDGLVPLNSELSKINFKKFDNGVLLLDSGQKILSPTVGYFSSQNKAFKYFYDGNELFILRNKYLKYLSTLESLHECSEFHITNHFRRSTSTLRKFSSNLHANIKAQNNFALVRNKINIQVSILGGYTYNSYNSDFGSEKGFAIELRENNSSPNISLAIGKGWYRGQRTVEIPGNRIKKVNNPSSTYVRLNYHFFAGKNLRPYIGTGIKEFKYPYISGVESSFIFFRGNNFTNKVMGSVGVDFYFLRFNQLRIEASVVDAFEFNVSYGFCFK